MDERYEIVISQRARRRMADIFDYMYRNASPLRAEKINNGLLDAINSLEKMPHSYKRVLELCSDEVTYRRKLKWSYQIIFRIKEEEKEVFVFDVFHSRQDPAKLKKLLD